MEDILEDIYAEVHENNIMLRQIVKVINVYLARHKDENTEDFIRNVIANLVSGTLNLDRSRNKL